MYEQAHITHLQSTTRDAVVQLLNDSVKLITSPRQFNDEERAVIKKYKLEVDTFKIAYDAALVLVNEKNSLTRIRVEELKDILLGKAKTWHDVGEKKIAGRIVVALGGREQRNVRIREAAHYKFPAVCRCRVSLLNDNACDLVCCRSQQRDRLCEPELGLLDAGENADIGYRRPEFYEGLGIDNIGIFSPAPGACLSRLLPVVVGHCTSSPGMPALGLELVLRHL